MAYWRKMKTEHAGPKNIGRKSGFYGLRVEAKAMAKKVRRQRDKRAIAEDE